MHCDPATIPATGNSHQPWSDSNLISGKVQSHFLMIYAHIYLLLTALKTCLCNEEEGWSWGRIEAGMPSMISSCKATFMSKALSCVRLHLSAGLGGCGAKNHWDVLIWSHRGWTTGARPTCDWLRHLETKGQYRFQQIWAGTAWAYIRGRREHWPPTLTC